MCVSLSFFFHHHKTALLGGPEIVRLWQVHLTGNAEKICLAAVNHFISFWNSFSCFCFFVILFLSLFWIVSVKSLPTWLLSFFLFLYRWGDIKFRLKFRKSAKSKRKRKKKWRNKYTRQQFLCTYKATTTSLLLPASRRSILSSPFFPPMFMKRTRKCEGKNKTSENPFAIPIIYSNIHCLLLSLSFCLDQNIIKRAQQLRRKKRTDGV